MAAPEEAGEEVRVARAASAGPVAEEEEGRVAMAAARPVAVVARAVVVRERVLVAVGSEKNPQHPTTCAKMATLELSTLAA